jgi:hypothetical protein
MNLDYKMICLGVCLVNLELKLVSLIEIVSYQAEKIYRHSLFEIIIWCYRTFIQTNKMFSPFEGVNKLINILYLTKFATP